MAQHIPGRFQVWLNHFAVKSYADYVAKFPKQVEQLEQAFEFMKTDETALEKHFNQRFDTPEEFVFRLSRAFNDKDLLAIKDIALQLSFVASAEHCIVKSLATGMLLELKNSEKDALIHYLTVDPNRKNFAIQQQVFPLAFSLQQPDKGLQALSSLSLMNVNYVPKYAEALDILGDADNAIAIYRAYPLLYKDTDAMIELIRLLVYKQDVEAANTLLQKAEASASLDQAKLQAFVHSLNDHS